MEHTRDGLSEVEAVELRLVDEAYRMLDALDDKRYELSELPGMSPTGAPTDDEAMFASLIARGKRHEAVRLGCIQAIERAVLVLRRLRRPDPRVLGRLLRGVKRGRLYRATEHRNFGAWTETMGFSRAAADRYALVAARLERIEVSTDADELAAAGISRAWMATREDRERVQDQGRRHQRAIPVTRITGSNPKILAPSSILPRTL